MYATLCMCVHVRPFYAKGDVKGGPAPACTVLSRLSRRPRYRGASNEHALTEYFVIVYVKHVGAR